LYAGYLPTREIVFFVSISADYFTYLEQCSPAPVASDGIALQDKAPAL
jgi:hypothetical protein